MRSIVGFEGLSLTAADPELMAGLATVLPLDGSRRPWWPWALTVLGMALIVAGALLFQ